LSLTHAIAERYFAENKAHVRLRRLYANALLAIGKTYDSTKVLEKAEALFRQNIADSPKRQTYLMDHARLLTEMGRLKEAEELLRRTVALDPSIGEPRWELGKFTWNQLKRPEEGAKMMADASIDLSHFNGITDLFAPPKPMEWQQLAQACSRAGEIEKLRTIVLAARAFDKKDRRLGEFYLGIARYMEQSGLLVERDEVLRIASERNPSLAPALAPVLAGKASLSSQQAGSEPNAKAKPSPYADARSPAAQDPQISLARTL
jgi:tetratricopeptide (TPR) repeat protein